MSTEYSDRVAIWAKPSFACAGVNWGIRQLELVLEEHGRVYIPNPNGFVHYGPELERLMAKGAVFTNGPEEIPEGSVVANSMHGLSPQERKVYIERRFVHYELSCPLVSNVYDRVRMAISEAEKGGKTARILYACKDTIHPEPKSVIELAPNHVIPVTGKEVLEEYQVKDNEMYFADSQTTINVQAALDMIDEFRDKFPNLRSYLARMGACFATNNRQQALNALIEAGIDKLVVVGSSTSANTTQLKKIGEARGIPVEFPETADDLTRGKFDSHKMVGVTGGASVRPQEGDRVMARLEEWGFKKGELVVGKAEPETFNLMPRKYNYRFGNISPETLQLIKTY